ncbi:transglutaminase-like domain-containing protein [Emticicia sp. 17c]|uniref:transglutaminase-like domain-containing protein n=1 Tax=Emticicia sp. 17c TaxID=3127704 RepID=UPI00301E1A4D
MTKYNTGESITIPVKDTAQTAEFIAHFLIPRWSEQDNALKHIKGQSLIKLSENIYNFCRKNFRYAPDPNGLELIRSPMKSWEDRKRGIDCEDFAILISTILLQKGFNPYIRIVDYGQDWQHIYVYVKDKNKLIFIDPVAKKFNKEVPFMKHKDFKVSTAEKCTKCTKYKKCNNEMWRVHRNNGLGRIGIDPIEARKNKCFVDGGNKYCRQEVLKDIIKGKDCKISFSFDVVVDGYFAIIPAALLQPSHLGNIENPLHFIPEAQPRNRSLSESGATTPVRIAENLRPAEISEGSTAYTGTPIVNARGETIQGNGRGYTMKYYWDNFENDPKGYIDYLIEEKNNFGLPKKISNRGHNRILLESSSFGQKDIVIYDPVLVRVISVSDIEAIKLGQYKQSDLEALSTKTNEIKSRVNLINEQKLSRVLDNVFAQSNPDDSLGEIIRSTNLLTQLIKLGAIRTDQLEEFERNGVINARGVQYVSDILLTLIFKGSDTNTPEIFAQLPVKIQNAIVKATPYLLRASDEKSIRKEVSKAILATRDFLSSGTSRIIAWEKQTSMFGGSPKEQFSDFERRLVEIFTTSQTQREIVEYFEKYQNAITDQPADLVSPARFGLNKNKAIELIFQVKLNQSGKGQISNYAFVKAKAKLKLLSLKF